MSKEVKDKVILVLEMRPVDSADVSSGEVWSCRANYVVTSEDLQESRYVRFPLEPSEVTAIEALAARALEAAKEKEESVTAEGTP